MSTIPAVFACTGIHEEMTGIGYNFCPFCSEQLVSKLRKTTCTLETHAKLTEEYLRFCPGCGMDLG